LATVSAAGFSLVSAADPVRVTVPLVATVLVTALAWCRLRASLGSTADGVAVSALLVPTLSLWATAAGASGIWATAAEASGTWATAAEAARIWAAAAGAAAGIWATGVGGWGVWATEVTGWERSANVTTPIPTTAAMLVATMILRDVWEFILRYSVGLASGWGLPGSTAAVG
jgi:hypothetical protein